MSIVLASVLTLALSACGGGGDGDKTWTSGTGGEGASSQVIQENSMTNSAVSELEGGMSESSGTAEGASVPENTQATTISFDERLVGRWYQVYDLTQDNGEIKFSDLFNSIMLFLPDGRFAGDTIITDDGTFFLKPQEIETIQTAGISPVKATAENGELNLFQPFVEYWNAISSAANANSDSFTEGLNQFSNIRITYEFEDIQEDMEDTFKEHYVNYFKKFDNDKLTLHITGDYQTSPVETQKVDTTLVYEKSYPNFGEDSFARFYLCGNWKDSSGNAWSFTFDEETDYDLSFSMTDSEGNAHTGDYLRQVYGEGDNPDCQEFIEFYFEDFSTPTYEIISFDSNTLSMKNSETGEAFTLTRQASAPSAE